MRRSSRSSRREFLRRTACAAASAAAAQAGFSKLGLMNLYARPLAPSDYRALVCVFLDGGSDTNNVIIPTDTTHYNQYIAARPIDSGLGIDAADLLPIDTPPVFGGTGRTFGLHPSLTELQGLFNDNKMAVVCNVGPLVEPVTQQDITDESKPLPYALFSHSDQVGCWATGRADQRIPTGWGGRIADATLACNTASGFPTVTSIDGAAVFTLGLAQNPLAIDTGALDQVLVLNGYYGSPGDVARKNAMDFARTIDRSALLMAATSDLTQQAVDISGAFSVDPTIGTTFPSTWLGDQLLQVAKVMKLNLTSPQLSLNRQIFFVTQGGYDTHQSQGPDHAALLSDLSAALSAFYAATQELGLADRVTSFTLSDFGRTLGPSGDYGSVGTDHGWGSHQLVLGGGVNGGDFYGTPNGATGSMFPELVYGGPDDVSPYDRGRWIPTTAVEQYGATLASWFGVPAGDLSTVFPLIGNFGSTNLGFLGAGSGC